MRSERMLVIFFIVSTIVSSCSTRHRDGGSGEVFQTGIDDLGRKVALPRAPRRIVSLAPNATEILFAIGAGDRLVGVTEYCDYPPEAKEIQRVGSFSYLSIERILSVAPDLVVMSSYEQERFVETLEDLGIPVYVCFPRSYRELFRSIETIGRLTGNPERATALVDSLESDLARLEEEVRDTFAEEDRPRVYFEISSRPLMTVGDDSFVGDLIEASGGRNVGHGIPRDYAVINPEVVIARNPDVIFIFQSSTSRENLAKRLGWDRINAVKNGLIFDDLDEDIVLRPGPRSVRGAREIFSRLVAAKETYGQDLVAE